MIKKESDQQNESKKIRKRLRWKGRRWTKCELNDFKIHFISRNESEQSKNVEFLNEKDVNA